MVLAVASIFNFHLELYCLLDFALCLRSCRWLPLHLNTFTVETMCEQYKVYSSTKLGMIEEMFSVGPSSQQQVFISDIIELMAKSDTYFNYIF